MEREWRRRYGSDGRLKRRKMTAWSVFSVVRCPERIATNISGDLRLIVMSPAERNVHSCSQLVCGGLAAAVRAVAWACLLMAATGPLWAQLPAARISYLFPPGGKAGTSFEVNASGSNLDEPSRIHFSHTGITAEPKSEAGKFTVTIASNVPPGIYEARFA